MALTAWRHPKPRDVAGRCIGRTDVPVDRRKAKRLAHRIRAFARRGNWPRVVWTSPLRRSADVGRWLARWGWRHHIDVRLIECDFGAWDGRAWAEIGRAEIDAWTADFGAYAPGCGESVSALMARCASFLAEAGDVIASVRTAGADDVAGASDMSHLGAAAASTRASPPRLVVGHAGWISAARWCGEGRAPPYRASDWPPSLVYGARIDLRGALPSSG